MHPTFYSWVNSRRNLCFTIFICWRYRPLHLLGQIFKALFCCFFIALNLTTAVFYMCCLQYPHTVYDNRNMWIYSFCLLWLKGKPDCKLFHVLYLTWQNLISSNSFSLLITAVTFEHLNVWFPVWFSRTVQSVHQIDTLVLSMFFGNKIPIYCLDFTEHIDLFILVYHMA